MEILENGLIIFAVIALVMDIVLVKVYADFFRGKTSWFEKVATSFSKNKK